MDETITEKWKVFTKSNKPDRYIWLNRHVWWCTLTLISENGLFSRRARFSLKTQDVEVARRRRDRIISSINNYEGQLEV